MSDTPTFKAYPYVESFFLRAPFSTTAPPTPGLYSCLQGQGVLLCNNPENPATQFKAATFEGQIYYPDYKCDSYGTCTHTTQ